ncbi:hypothetical protein [Streptomyces bobili]|uniref:hypothetical protein n=1 Tax=Streptomyces bobili TaxID=67280 RepID=UPI003716C113
MRPKTAGRLTALTAMALLLASVTGVSAAQAQPAAPSGEIEYSIAFSNPWEGPPGEEEPEPYGVVFVSDSGGRQTELWRVPDLDQWTPTMPRYPDYGTEFRYADHPVTEVCAFVGEDDTGINRDDVLAEGCTPYTGPGPYEIHSPGGEREGSVTVTIESIGS